VYDGTWAGSAGFKNGRYIMDINCLWEIMIKTKVVLYFLSNILSRVLIHGMKDSLGNDYFMQGKNHTLINRAYCIENPHKFKRLQFNMLGTNCRR